MAPPPPPPLPLHANARDFVLLKSESLAILERTTHDCTLLTAAERDSHSDSHRDSDATAYSKQHARAPSSCTAPTPAAASPAAVRLDVTLRQARLLVLTAVVVSILMVLVITFRHGLELTRFPADTKSDKQKTQLLDDYNSYSGTIASFVARPLEIFVAMLMQVVVVRGAAAAMLRPETSTRAWIIPLVLSAGVAYLINNGFNALNVQLRSLEIRPVISASDLSSTNVSSSLWSPINATSIHVTTISESVANNAITNTVLRNLVRAREPKAPLHCKRSGYVTITVPDDLLEYGIPQKDWQARLLPHALAPQRLRLSTAAATNDTVVPPVQPSELPMNASLAGELVMQALMLAGHYVPVQEASYFTKRLNPHVDLMQGANKSAGLTLSGAVVTMAGLLPSTTSEKEQATDETTQREWLLERTPGLVANHFSGFASNDSGIEFARVQISPSIVFDAVTFELEMDPAAYNDDTKATNGSSSSSSPPLASTRQVTVARRHCGPWPALCQFIKPTITQLPGSDGNLYDPAMQVQAFAICVDANGSETLRADVVYSDGDAFPPTGIRGECNATSNSSLLIVSVAKRLTADSLKLQRGSDALDPTQGNVTATNVRKILSFTVGRLSWQLQNLSTVFHATCESTSPQSCLGLHVNLSNAEETQSTPPRAQQNQQQQQQLVVSGDALPLQYAIAHNYDYGYSMSGVSVNLRPKTRTMPLVRVHEPPRPRPSDDERAADEYNILAGDMLLSHNIQAIRGNTSALWMACSSVVEDRLQLVLKNHLYMEHGLQPAYTAAVFFLLQNGVVKDTIALSATKSSLNFDNNRQEIAVWISVPDLNAWLTLAGCVVMAVCVLIVMLWTTRLSKQPSKQDPLQQITTPHVIARVMLDEVRFPPQFFKFRVADNHDDNHELQFHIQSMTLTSNKTPASPASPASPLARGTLSSTTIQIK